VIELAAAFRAVQVILVRRSRKLRIAVRAEIEETLVSAFVGELIIFSGAGGAAAALALLG
jgi:hypothetical protein